MCRLIGHPSLPVDPNLCLLLFARLPAGRILLGDSSLSFKGRVAMTRDEAQTLVTERLADLTANTAQWAAWARTLERFHHYSFQVYIRWTRFGVELFLQTEIGNVCRSGTGSISPLASRENR